MTDPITIIAYVIAIVVAVVLIVLFKKRIIDADVIDGTTQVLEGLPVAEMNGGAFATIRSYAEIAVKAVDQLVKLGVIQREDKARKDKAMEIIENAARVDGLPYGAEEMAIADICVEAEVYDLPRNQKPPNAAEE